MKARIDMLNNIKGAVLDKYALSSYLEKLASDQIPMDFSDKRTCPINIMKQEFKYIEKTYNLLNEHAKLKITIHPAGEWLLDNFYLIEETSKIIEKEMTVSKYRNLNGIANGTYKGFNRAYVLATEIVAYTDGNIEEENLKLFLSSYQRKKSLTMEEIWNIPLFMQIAIIHNICKICEKIYSSQIQKYKVESIVERLIEQKEKQTFKNNVKNLDSNKESMKYAFIEHMSYKLKRLRKKGIRIPKSTRRTSK